MIISKRSTFFRFLDTNWFTVDNDIPSNLCPYMRKVLGSVIVNFLLMCVATWLFSCLVVAVMSLFLPPDIFLVGIFVPMALLGFVQWSVLIIGLCIYGIMISPIADATGRATHKVASSNSMQTTAVWIHAAHNKVCPRIDFD